MIDAKPSWRYEVIDGTFRRYPDGREVCCDNNKGRKEYRRRREEMAARQNNRCAYCSQPFFTYDPPTFEHEDGRGGGGFRRDDRIVDEHGEWMNFAMHSKCNQEKGSQRL